MKVSQRNQLKLYTILLPFDEGATVEIVDGKPGATDGPKPLAVERPPLGGKVLGVGCPNC